MRADVLRGVVDLARRIGHVYVATADVGGMPHITVAGSLEQSGKDTVLIKEWFCPGTIANLKMNRAIALAAWDVGTDTGYQVLGFVERVDDLAVADGYDPQVEERQATPQIEKQLVIRVEKVLDFTLTPHYDVAVETAST
jgi:uncharacterized protein